MPSYKFDPSDGFTTKERGLYKFFKSHPNCSFSRAHIIKEVWGETDIDDMSLTVHIARLRRKLGKKNKIMTDHGMGYRWVP